MENINYFIPVDILSKGRTGKKEMIVAGIISTASEDADGESIVTTGWDTTPFLRHGFINWNHLSKSDPSAAIGEPLKVEIRPEGLYMEAKLYPESKVACDVYELAQILRKSGSTRKVGFSIEGKALRRCKDNPKRILKAALTGCAITLCPKNTDTNLFILKSHQTENDLIKSHINGVEIDALVDVQEGNTRYVVDTKGNLIKSINTGEAGEPLQKESLEGTLKEQNNFKRKKKKKLLNKAETLEILKWYVTEPDQLEKAFEFVCIINDLKMKVSENAIKEAMELLGLSDSSLVKSEGLTDAELDLFKGVPEPEETEEEETEETEEETEETEGEETEKSHSGFNALVDLMKSNNDRVDGKFSALTDLMKSQTEQLEKAISENAELKKGFTELANKVSEFEKQSLGHKSVITKSHVERFENTGSENNLNNLSVTRNKKVILDILDKATDWKNLNMPENDILAKAQAKFEVSGTLAPEAIKKLNSLGYTVSQ